MWPACFVDTLFDVAKLGGFLQAGGVAHATLCNRDHSAAASPNIPSKGLGTEQGKAGSLGGFQVNQVLVLRSLRLLKYHSAKWKAFSNKTKKKHAKRARMLSPKIIKVRKLILIVDLQYLRTVGCSKEVVRKAPWWALAVNYLIFINFLTTSVNFLSFLWSD